MFRRFRPQTPIESPQAYWVALAARLNGEMKETGVERTYELTGGHPHMVRVHTSSGAEEGPVPIRVVPISGDLEVDVAEILERIPHPWPRIGEDPSFLAFRAS